MERQAVKVTWLDPYSVDEWESLDKLKECKPMIVESFGYEIHRDDSVTIISSNLDEKLGPQASCSTVIPECCIEEYEYIDVE